MGAKIPGEDLGGDGHIVVAVMDPLDLLIPLRALARDDDRIRRARIQNRLSYRVASARCDLVDVVHVGTRRGDAPQEIVANRLGIFAPRILVGHPQDIGLARGNRREFLALARVAVSVGAKDDDDPTGGELPGRA